MADPAPLAFAVKDFQPASFAERGAHVPFTSPMLAHARLRIGPRGGRELVIRNPAGGEGFYVGPWPSMIDSARLSVHDRLLYRRIEAANVSLPLDIRRVAREVALEGFAGRPASAAARAALDAEADARARIRLALLAACSPPPAEADAARLDEFAAVLAPLGLDADADAQLMRDLAAVRGLCAALDALPGAEAACSAEIRAIQQSADTVIRLVAQARAEALAGTARPRTLLDSPAALARCAALVTRIAWLLDGWPALAAVWQAAEPRGLPATRWALAEIAANLPQLPREAAGAQAAGAGLAAPPASRRIRAGQDWLSGVAERDLVARNEAMLARAV